MLTTADKLRRKPTEIGKPQYLYQGLPNLDYNQMLSSGQPSKYLMSLFHETTLEEEMKQMCEKKDVDNNETYTLGTYITYSNTLLLAAQGLVF